MKERRRRRRKIKYKFRHNFNLSYFFLVKKKVKITIIAKKIRKKMPFINITLIAFFSLINFFDMKQEGRKF